MKLEQEKIDKITKIIISLTEKIEKFFESLKEVLIQIVDTINRMFRTCKITPKIFRIYITTKSRRIRKKQLTRLMKLLI